MFKCVDFNTKKNIDLGCFFVASRCLSRFGRVPHVFEFRDFYKNKFEFRLFLWPRGASAGMDGFLKCSNALLFIRFGGGDVNMKMH